MERIFLNNNSDHKESKIGYLLFIIFVILSSGIITIGYFAFLNYEQRHRSEVENRLSDVAESKIDLLVQWRYERIGDGQTFYKNDLFSNMVYRYLQKQNDLEAKKNILTWMEQVQGAYKYDLVMLFDAQFNTKLTFPEKIEPPRLIIDQESTKTLLSGNIVFQDFYKNDQDQRIYLKILVPILDVHSPNRIIAVLALRIDPEHSLYPLIIKWPTTSQTSEILVVRQYGNDVFFLNDLKFKKNAALNLRIPLESKDVLAVKAVSGIEGIVEGLDYRGVPVIGYVRAVPNSPWFMIAKMDIEEVYAPVRERLWLLIILVCALLFSAGSGVLLIWRRQRNRFYREQYKSAEALHESETRFRALIESSPDAITQSDLDGKILMCNKQTALLHGYEYPEELIGTSVFALFPPDELERARLNLRKTLKDGIIRNTEYRLLKKDGSQFYTDLSAAVIADTNGKPASFIAMTSNITERKLREEALKNSEQQNKIIARMTTDYVFIVDVDYQNNLKLRWTSENLRQITGRTISEVETSDLWKKIIFPEDTEYFFKFVDQILTTAKSGEMECRSITKSGVERWIHLFAQPETDENNRINIIIGAVKDITERKQTEEAVRALSMRQQAILASVPDIIMEVDNNKIYTWANDEGIDFFGDDVINKEASYFFEGTQETYGIVSPLFMGDENTIYVESWQRRKDGEKRLLAWWCRALKDSSGNVTGALSSARDITEHKRDEEKIFKANRVYAVISEINQAIVRIRDKDKLLEEVCHIAIEYGKFQMAWIGLLDEETKLVNPITFAGNEDGYFSKIVKISINDVPKGRGPTGTAIREGKHSVCEDIANDPRMVPWRDEALQRGYRSSIALPIKHFGKVIGAFSLYASTTRFFDDDEITLLDEVTKDFSFALDAIETEKKRQEAEEALRKSEEKFRKAFMTSPDSVTINRLKDGMYVSINQGFTRIMGYTEGDILGKTSIETNIWDDPGDRNKLVEGLKKDGMVENLEARFRSKSGEIKYGMISASIIELDGIQYILGIVRDITERMQIEGDLIETRELFQKIFQLSPLANALEKLSGRIIVDINNACETLFGYTRTELIGKPITDFDIWENAEERMNASQILKREGKLRNKEFSFKTKSGSVGRAILFAEIVEQRGEKYILSKIIDITERKQAEETIRRSHEFNELLLRANPFGMDIVDEQGTILFMNDTLKKIIGMDAIGLNCWSSYKDDKTQCLDCPLRKGIELGTVEVLETAVVFGGRIFQINHVGILYEGKKAMLEVFVDVTEQRNLQNQFFQSQKIQSIGTLAGGIAHDFNNILGIIIGYSSFLERGSEDKKKIMESSASITKAAERGAALVRQILTFARRTDVSFQPLNLPDFIIELIPLLEETFPKVIKIRKIIEGNIPVIIADYTQMHQSLLNLCLNARDAMPSGGTLDIKLSTVENAIVKKHFITASAERYVCISVSDTGVGMNADTRNRIFDPFFTTKEKGKGTGLGLSVVYGVMQTHHGFVDVESVEGKGSTFSLFLPVPSDLELDRGQAGIKNSDIPGGTETILLVEDEELLRNMLRELLESKGYIIHAAVDGLEAVEFYKAHQNKIDLVLTDMGLPKMTGVEAFGKLKEINPNVKVLLASGFFEPNIKSELYKTGIKGFLQKPYKPEEVLLKIREVLDIQ